MTSLLRTKKGESSLPRMFSASLRGPAVPRGSDSTENVILTLNCFSYYDRDIDFSRQMTISGISTYLLKLLRHDLRAVVYCQNNVCDTSFCESSYLVFDHGLVGKLDEGFRKGQSL